MAENKYFYQDGFLEQQEEKKLKNNSVWIGKTLDEVKESVINLSLDEEQYGAFSIEFWKDETLVWICLKAEHDFKSIFSHVRKFLWRDKEFVLGTMDEKWFYPLTNIHFQDQQFDYFDYIHDSLKEDQDIISALNKLKNLESK